MSTDYTVENFENDLKQLGGMIEGFYQNGGKKKRSVAPAKKKKMVAKKKVAKKSVAGKKKVKRRQDGGEDRQKRTFKIVEVNGRPYPYYKRYRGAEPLDAAKKAFKFACKKLGMGKEACNITFTLKETSRGSKKRDYGPYKGKWMKLSKPKVYTPPGRAPVKITHSHHVELVGKSK
jgi:hypothetical protein